MHQVPFFFFTRTAILGEAENAKISVVILTLLLASIAAPNAHAGSITYSFTGAGKWTGTHFVLPQLELEKAFFR